MKNKLVFWSQMLLHPFQVASPIPSAPSTVDCIVQRVQSDTKKVVVEYGPGEGVITRGLLQEGVFTSDTVFILIEANRALARFLKNSIDDPRVRVFHDSAEHIDDILDACGVDMMDIVISGIPYSLIPEKTRDGITFRTSDRLRKPDGRYLAYNKNGAAGKSMEPFFPYVTPTPLENDGKPRLTLYEGAFVDPLSESRT